MSITFDPRTDLAEVIADLQAIASAQGTTAPAATEANVKVAVADDKTPPDTSEVDAEEAKKAEAAAKRKAAAAKKKEEEAAAAKEAEEAAAAEAEKEEEKPAPKNSRDDVRAALKEHAALEGKDAAIQILKDHGAASITELSEDKFDEVVAACG